MLNGNKININDKMIRTTFIVITIVLHLNCGHSYKFRKWYWSEYTSEFYHFRPHFVGLFATSSPTIIFLFWRCARYILDDLPSIKPEEKASIFVRSNHFLQSSLFIENIISLWSFLPSIVLCKTLAGASAASDPVFLSFTLAF